VGAPPFILIAGRCLKVLGHQGGMFSESIAVAVDLDDDGVVKEVVEAGGSDDAIAEYLPPLCEASVTREDNRPFLVAGIDQLEEQLSAAAFERQVAHFVISALPHQKHDLSPVLTHSTRNDALRG